MPKDVYLQPGAPDPILPESRVLALARLSVPDASSVTAIDESGGEARAYLIDSAVVVKVQRPHRLRPRTDLVKEAFFLTQLAADPRIPVPHVFSSGYTEPDVRYIVMERMSGVAFRRVPLAGSARTAALTALGHTLRLIHTLPQEPLRASGLFPGDDSPTAFHARVEALFGETLPAVEERIEARTLAWPLPVSPAQIATEALGRLSVSADLVALHANPGPEHVFIDPHRQTFTGLIDFGDAYISHPALDLRRWPHPRDRAALLDGYQEPGPVSADFRRVWQSVMLLTDLTVLAQTTDQALAQAVFTDVQYHLS